MDSWKAFARMFLFTMLENRRVNSRLNFCLSNDGCEAVSAIWRRAVSGYRSDWCSTSKSVLPRPSPAFSLYPRKRFA